MMMMMMMMMIYQLNTDNEINLYCIVKSCTMNYITNVIGSEHVL